MRAKRRRARPKTPRLRISDILAWADAYHKRMGRWPSSVSGRVRESPRDNWAMIDQALRRGCRGCVAGSSLPLFLHRYRGRPLGVPYPRPRLSFRKILAWADAHHRRTGCWPKLESGPIVNAPPETWTAIDLALKRGHRGLRRGYTLASLLAKRRGAPYRKTLQRFTKRGILAWADAHHRRNGRWPSLLSGPIPEAPGATWKRVEGALNKGQRGLPGGDSLSRLLKRNNRLPLLDQWGRRQHRPPLLIPQILTWADEHYRRTNKWPRNNSGPIAGISESWTGVNVALSKGGRGLRGGSSLAKLLEEHRGRRRKDHPPRLTVRKVLAWADAYHRVHGCWPSRMSGPIPESPGDSWLTIDGVLYNGSRGQPGGNTLLKLLHRRGRISDDDARVKRKGYAAPLRER